MKKIISGLILCTLLSPLLVLAEDASSTPVTVPITDSTPADAAPASAAYQFQRQGIFDCNQNGAYAMSVGTTAATGGVFVPVSDSGITLNTGTLVYKECVLREVIDREREAAMAAFLKKGYVGIQTGRDGNPLYVQSEGQELVTDASDPAFVAMLQDGTLQNVNSALQGPITRALAKNYYATTRAPEDALKCSYAGDLNAAFAGHPDGDIFDALLAVGTPSCNPIGEYFLAEGVRNSRISQSMAYLHDSWDWGNGYYPVTDNALDPLARQILTPAVTVQQSFQTLLDSPVHQLESANDVGQMIGALYAGITTQVISDNRGLTGLSARIGSQPSYLDQVAKESSQGLRGAAVNAALNILGAARQVEGSFLQTVNALGTLLTTTIGQLRGAENKCWSLIIPKVCTTPLAPNNTCQGVSGNALQVATSTAFSQAVIDAQIASLANQTITNINNSQKAVGLIDNLIAGVTNTASLDAQRLSLQQLDSLVAQHALHTQANLQTVSQQFQDAQSTMQTLVTNTLQAWGDNTDPNIGWCNVNNQATIDGWLQRWKK
jgi:hypothetical protein